MEISSELIDEIWNDLHEYQSSEIKDSEQIIIQKKCINKNCNESSNNFLELKEIAKNKIHIIVLIMFLES